MVFYSSVITKTHGPINTSFKYYLHFRRLKLSTAHSKITVAYLFLVQNVDETKAVSMLSRITTEEYVLETVKNSHCAWWRQERGFWKIVPRNYNEESTFYVSENIKRLQGRPLAEWNDPVNSNNNNKFNTLSKNVQFTGIKPGGTAQALRFKWLIGANRRSYVQSCCSVVLSIACSSAITREDRLGAIHFFVC